MVGPDENWRMAYELGADGGRRLEGYLDQLGGLLGNSVSAAGAPFFRRSSPTTKMAA